MHFAYPRECSYPHASGTVNLMSGEDWSRETGNKAAWSASEVQRYVEQLRPPTGPADWLQQQHQAKPPQRPSEQDSGEESGACMAMWDNSEELVDEDHWKTARQAQQQAEASFKGADALRALMLLGFVISSLAMIRGFLQQASDAFNIALTPESGFKKCGSSKTSSCFV